MLVSIDFNDGGLAVKNLTVRDYFAAMAMHALLTNPELQNMHEKDSEDCTFWLEEFAWEKADAMLHTRDFSHKVFRYPIEELKLDRTTVDSLKATGIHTIGDLCGKHVFDIKRIPNLGSKRIKQINDALERVDLHLSGFYDA